jgi:hypothetical protein
MKARKPSVALCTLVCLAAPALPAWPALAVINPRFTPVELVREAAIILLGEPEPAAEAHGWRLDKVVVLKGKADGPQVLSAAGLPPQRRQEFEGLIKGGAGPMVLFASGAGATPNAVVHMRGQWLKAEHEAGCWGLVAFNPALDGTYAGGTDMLIRMCGYILAHPDALVPVSAGLVWRDWTLLMTAPDAISGLAVVSIEGKRCLFVGSPAGDRLFASSVAQQGMESMADLTGHAGIDTRSQRFLWLDVDLDGASDLITWEGRGLSLRLMRKGRLQPAAAGNGLNAGADCLALAAAGMSPGGAVRVLMSTSGLPRLIELRRGREWVAVDLSGPASRQDDFPSACIVADLDNDGFVDVVQPREHGGLFWRGGPDGFGVPLASPVKCPRGHGVAGLGDFNGDGSLDVFLGGADGNELWENDGRAGFRPVLAHSASLSYKASYRVSAAVATDLGHDGRPDLALGSREAGFVYHFNRGFRCFGEQGELRLNEVGEVPNLADWGVQALAVGDLDGNDTEDLAVAFVGGEVHAYFSSLFRVAGVRVRPSAGTVGPVTVSAWQGEDPPYCCATWTVVDPGVARLFSGRDSGVCTLRFRLPGQPPATKKVVANEQIPLIALK